MLWHFDPVPAFPAFRGGLGPWHRDRDHEPLRPWDPAEFPEASRLLEESLVLGSETAPLFVQEADIMQGYVEAVEKVLGSLDAVLAAPYEPIQTH